MKLTSQGLPLGCRSKARERKVEFKRWYTVTWTRAPEREDVKPDVGWKKGQRGRLVRNLPAYIPLSPSFSISQLKKNVNDFFAPPVPPPVLLRDTASLFVARTFLSNLITFYPFWWLGLKVCSVSEEVVTHSFLPAFSLFLGVQAFLSVLGRQGREMEEPPNYPQEAWSRLMQHNSLDIDWPLFVRFISNQA